MAPKLSLIALLLVSLSLFSTAARGDGTRQCYFTNGKVATGYSPCDPDAEQSPCCNAAAGHSCLQNTLCQGPNQELSRGACTDETWKAGGACKRYCFGVFDAEASIVRCSNDGSNETGANYCCVDTIAAGSQWYWFGPENLAPVASFNAESNRYSALTTAKPHSTAAPGATVTVVNGTPQGTVTGTVTVSISVAADGTATTETPASGGSVKADKGSGLPAGAWAGIGIGALVMAVLVSVVGYMLWKRHQTKKVAAELNGGGIEGAGGKGFKRFDSSELKWPPGFNELPTDSDTSEMDSNYVERRELPTDIQAAEMDAKGLDRGELPTGWEAPEMDGSEKKELPLGGPEYHAKAEEVYAGLPTNCVELPAERYH